MSGAKPNPTERVDDIDRILIEMQRAVREALARHKLAGNPVPVWEDGRVRWIPAEEIPVAVRGETGSGR
jgi:hypothetical protein